MILTSLTLKDWKHLRHVALLDFVPGINVIHGPNKAGKSTVAEAVRIALVDRDHSATAADVKALNPWTGGGGAIPTAKIGFVVNGKSWRMEKRFSGNRGGGAELFDEGSANTEVRDREVTGEVRNLLGISKSTEGLGALLWPDQGNAALPDVDQPLGDALRQLLGVQITAGDTRFQEKLTGKMVTWFTPTGRPSREVTNRDTAVGEQRSTVDDLLTKRQRREHLVREHSDKKAEHAEARKAVEETRKAIGELEPRVLTLAKRKQQLKDIAREQTENAGQQESVKSDLQSLGVKAEGMQQAEKNAAEAAKAIEPLKLAVDAREQDLRESSSVVADLEPRVHALDIRKRDIKEIEGRQQRNTKDRTATQLDLAELKNKAEELKRAEKAASEAALGLEPLEQALDRAETQRTDAQQAVENAEASDSNLRKLEARSTVLRQLADLERNLSGKHEALAEAHDTEQRLTALWQELASISPCDDEDRTRLNELLDELRDVEASLRAAAVTVTLTPEANTGVSIGADGESRDERLTAGAAYDVVVLQDAALHLRGWGSVQIKRGGATGTLSEQRMLRDSLRTELDALRVKLALEGVEQGEWISELTSRAATRQSKGKEAKQLAKELKKQAPEGIETLAAECQREEVRLAEGKRAAGLAETGSVAEAVTAMGDLATLRGEIDAALERAREARDKAREAYESAAAQHTDADKCAQRLKGEADAARRLLEDAQQRTGGEVALNKGLDDLVEVAHKLAEELDRAQLTEEERRLPDELEAARKTRNAAQEALDAAQAKHRAAVEAHEKEKNRVQAAKAVLDAEIKRTDGEEELRKRLAILAAAAAELKEELGRSQLSPEEERLEETLNSEREALRTREKREREISERLRTIEGELVQFDGLHGQLAAAEQKLASMEALLEREKLDGEAHKLIADWFKEELDKATERSLAPVSEHVQRWLRVLNNADSVTIEFNGNSLQAESLRVGGNIQSLDAATSYGEREQLGTLVRLAYACVLAKDEPQAVILDDPLAHSDSARHRRMLDVLADASKRNLQIIVLTCHPERFDQLKDAKHFDLELAKMADAST